MLIGPPAGQRSRVVSVLRSPASWGSKVSAQTGRCAFQKINRDNWFTSLLCAFWFPALLQPQAVSSSPPGTGCHLPPEEGGVTGCLGHKPSTGFQLRSLAGIGQALGRARVGVVQCVQLHGGTAPAGQSLRTTGGLHCLSPRSPRAGGAGTVVSTGGTMRPSRGGPPLPWGAVGLPSPLAAPSSWSPRGLWGPRPPPPPPNQLERGRWFLGGSPPPSRPPWSHM